MGAPPQVDHLEEPADTFSDGPPRRRIAHRERVVPQRAPQAESASLARRPQLVLQELLQLPLYKRLMAAGGHGAHVEIHHQQRGRCTAPTQRTLNLLSQSGVSCLLAAMVKEVE